MSYNLVTVLSAALHRMKKAPWPTLPLQIGLYEIKNFKVSNVKEKEIVKFSFGTQDFNLYDLGGICKDQCVRVYFPWIGGAFHWLEEDPWRICYNASKICELVTLAGTS